MKTCNKCGCELSEGASFCENCGAPVSSSEPVVETVFPNSNVPQTKDRSGLAIASLVLGCISILTWIIPLLGYPTTIVGLILGILGLKSSKKGMAVAGIILCAIFLVVTLLNSILGAILAAAIMSAELLA